MAKHLPEPRERILDAALVLFARFGLDGTTLVDIAMRAGLGKTTLYHHFPDGKGAIFRFAVHSLVGGHWEAFEAAVREEASPVSRLARYVRLRIDTYDREMLRWGLEQQAWEAMKPLVNDAIAPFFARELALLTDVVRDGMADGSMRRGRPETVARILQAAFRGLTLDGPVRPTAQGRSAEIEELASFIRLGLLSPGAHELWRDAVRDRTAVVPA